MEDHGARIYKDSKYPFLFLLFTVSLNIIAEFWLSHLPKLIFFNEETVLIWITQFYFVGTVAVAVG